MIALVRSSYFCDYGARITYRFTSDGRIVLLTTFRKQRNNEWIEVARAREVADDCVKNDP